MKLHYLLIGAAVLGLAGACTKKPDERAGGAPADPKLVERGAYLAELAGCRHCHMPMGPDGPDHKRAYAGGMEVPEKFGTWRAPNITPHPGTGIGAWTDEQIIAAIREGVRPDGRRLYPIMPYLNYNRMTDADAKALVAYLRTVPPIDHAVAPVDQLALPKIPAPKPANAPVPDEPVARGAYLVTLMHCTMCHATPDANGVPDVRNKPFSGGLAMELPPVFGTGTLYASNLTSDPATGLGKWTEAQIATAVKTMTRPDGSLIQGPMQLYLGGWSKIEDRDLQAVAAFIKRIPADEHQVPASTFKPAGAPR